MVNGTNSQIQIFFGMNPTFLFLKGDDNDRNISEKKIPLHLKMVQLGSKWSNYSLLVPKFHKIKKNSPNGFFCIYFRISKL